MFIGQMVNSKKTHSNDTSTFDAVAFGKYERHSNKILLSAQRQAKNPLSVCRFKPLCFYVRLANTIADEIYTIVF